MPGEIFLSLQFVLYMSDAPCFGLYIYSIIYLSIYYYMRKLSLSLPGFDTCHISSSFFIK